MIATSKLQAVILCGGRGTRLQSVVGDKPKALAEVAGRPFLERLLDGLHGQGVRNFVLCTGFGEAAIREYLSMRRKDGEILVCSRENTPLGTGGAVRNAWAYMTSDPVIVVNGDSWCDYSLGAFLDFHEQRNSAGSLLLTHTKDRSRYGSVDLDGNARITGFREKGRAAGEGWISAGVYILKRDWIGEIPEGQPWSMENDFFPRRIADGLYGWTGGSDFIDIGTPESFEQAQLLFRESCKLEALAG